MKNEVIILDDRQIQNIIYTIRGFQVILDKDLAELYQVETRVLNQAVKRNKIRFPVKLMFQLTEKEFKILVSQNAIPNRESLTSQSVISKDKRGALNMLERLDK